MDPILSCSSILPVISSILLAFSQSFNAWNCDPAGRRDSSGIRLFYTPTLRKYDAGIMELGLVYTPIMAIPPKEHSFQLTGYCTDKCTQTVSTLLLLLPSLSFSLSV